MVGALRKKHPHMQAFKWLPSGSMCKIWNQEAQESKDRQLQTIYQIKYSAIVGFLIEVR